MQRGWGLELGTLISGSNLKVTGNYCKIGFVAQQPKIRQYVRGWTICLYFALFVVVVVDSHIQRIVLATLKKLR